MSNTEFPVRYQGTRQSTLECLPFFENVKVMAKDYYEILGVPKTASADEVKKAFRELAHQHHPDKQGGTDAKFKEINEAYQVLGNPDKRKQYDQFGANFEQAG